MPVAGRSRACRDVRSRYLGREDVCHEFDCAGALRELLQKETALLRVQLGPTESAHGFGDTVSCPFCRWLQLKNGKGCLYMHLVRHHGPRKAFRTQWHQAAARRDGRSSV